MKKIFLGFLFFVLLGGSIEDVFCEDLASCKAKETQTEKKECFESLREAQISKIVTEKAKITSAMESAYAADKIIKLEKKISDWKKTREAADPKESKLKEDLLKKINEANQQLSNYKSISGYKDYLFDEGEKKNERLKLVNEYETIKTELSKLDKELKEIESNVENYAIRNAIINLSKQSSFFSVTGKKKVFKDGEYKETEMDPTMGLRATEYSQEAELTLGGDDSENNLLTRVIALGIRFMGTMVILFFVIAGFFMITSRGDENQLQKGKTIFTYAIIGAVVAFTSYIVVQFIVNILFISS